MPAKKNKTLIPTAISLPPQMHKDLKASGGERGLSEEIRRRLQASFDAEQRTDEKTRELLNLFVELSRSFITEQKWHENQYYFMAFKSGINAIMSRFEPHGDPRIPADAKPFYGEDTPEAVGRTVAGYMLQAAQRKQSEKE